MSFSHDGKFFAVGDSPSKSIRIYSTTDGSLVHELEKPAAETGNPTFPAFSSNDRFLVATYTFGKTYIWNTETEKISLVLTDASIAPVRTVSFSPDDRFILAVSSNGIYLFSAETGARVKFFPSPRVMPSFNTYDFWSARMSANLRMIIAASRFPKTMILTINAETGNLVSEIPAPGIIGTVNLSADLRKINLFFPDEGEWSSYEIATGRRLFFFSKQMWRENHNGFVLISGGIDPFRFSPDQNVFVSQDGNDWEVRVWRLKSEP